MNRTTSNQFAASRPGFSILAKRIVVSAGAVAMISVFTMGCSDSEPLLPQAYVNAQMGPGDNGAAKCQLPPGQWLVVGEQYSLKKDGDSQNGAAVSVSCEVRPESGVFIVTGQMVLKNGLSAGSMTITGRVTDKGDQTVNALFTRRHRHVRAERLLTFVRTHRQDGCGGRSNLG